MLKARGCRGCFGALQMVEDTYICRGSFRWSARSFLEVTQVSLGKALVWVSAGGGCTVVSASFQGRL